MKFHWQAIEKLARAHHLEDPTASLDAFRRYLEMWWCQHYNRPLKDALLQSYSLDELCYEYLRHHYAKPENDPKKELEAKTLKEEEETWIREQLAKVHRAQEEEGNQKRSDERKESVSSAPDISTQFESGDS